MSAQALEGNRFKLVRNIHFAFETGNFIATQTKFD